MTTIEISASLRLCNLPDPLTRQFMKDNTFRNPKHEQLKRLGKWTGAVVGGYRSPADAERAALKECEKRRSARRISAECKLYATGHKIVWESETKPAEELGSGPG